MEDERGEAFLFLLLLLLLLLLSGWGWSGIFTNKNKNKNPRQTRPGDPTPTRQAAVGAPLKDSQGQEESAVERDTAVTNTGADTVAQR